MIFEFFFCIFDINHSTQNRWIKFLLVSPKKSCHIYWRTRGKLSSVSIHGIPAVLKWIAIEFCQNENEANENNKNNFMLFVCLGVFTLQISFHNNSHSHFVSVQ